MNSQSAIEVIIHLQNNGHIAYLAGGSVRDMLFKLPSDDYDVATSATVEEIVNLFDKTLTIGAHFGVVIVIKKTDKIEVATFRKDGSYSNGRTPDFLERGTPEEDAKRRDFTINGLFYDPLTKTLYDFVGGVEDISNKILRAIGSPLERFAEDRLRMLRAVRFAQRFDLKIEDSTYEAIKATSPLLFPAVSVERVWQELDKMTPKKSAFNTLFDLGLLQVIFPGITRESIRDFPSIAPLIIVIALLFPKESLKKWLGLATFFKCSRASFNHLILLDKARQTPTSLYTWALYLALDKELFYATIWSDFWQKEYSWLEERRKMALLLKEDIQRLIEKKPLINAAYLQNTGIAPGPQMGQLLKKAEELSVNLRVTSAEQLLKLVLLEKLI